MTKIQLHIAMFITLLLFIFNILIIGRDLQAKENMPDCLYFPKSITVDKMAELIKLNQAIISDGANPLILNSRAVIVARTQGGYVTHILLSPELGNLCYELKH